MDIQTKKSDIKSLVLDLRRTLEKEMAIVLKQYGLQTDRTWPLDEPPARLRDEAEREIWQRIVATIRRGLREGRTLPQASQDFVREAAFTFLNRLVGLKCLEVRDLIPEVITTRDIYGGRSQFHRDYRDDHPRQAREADDALPAALAEACRRVNAELIGYLFDPDDEHSLVWPRYAVLKGCIEQINTTLEDWVWAEDEIIGWIYQFYNAEEKVAVRKRGKPKTPHDVAVINQFFTPRWVVKFLVDNTLGRLWLEMHPDSPRVRAKCDYLVPELVAGSKEQEAGSRGQGAGSPEQGAGEQGGKGAGSKAQGAGEQGSPGAAEQGAGEPGSQGAGETAAAEDSSFSDHRSAFILDPTSPINNPNAAPRREEKPITRIKLLDPACGTMHFGHYACEVFAAMYQDARAWGEHDIDEARIPATILEYNLFGVDIDRRAVQLAALSLFMKARTMHPDTPVTQVNLVVADATLPNGNVKQKFLERYARAPKVQKAFTQVLEEMDQVAQLGSLLRVEERLRELLTGAGPTPAAADFETRRQRNLPGFEPPTHQLGLADTLADDDQARPWTPHFTLQELRDDLRRFARESLQEHDVNAQLFATEADKAVRLLDVLMGEYDVVVMNPPYGDLTERGSNYLKRNYPSTKNDFYAAFYERALSFLRGQGYVGALTSRTYLTLSSFENLRREILHQNGYLKVVVDLGFGILDDAVVETCATVLLADERLSWEDCQGTFFRLNFFEQNREVGFKHALKMLRSEQISHPTYILSLTEFLAIPSMAIPYWAPANLRRKFRDFSSLVPDIAKVKQGLATADDNRFVREYWEVDASKIGKGRKWIPFAKGGDYSKYYYDHDLVVNWNNNGQEIKNYCWPSGRQRSRPQNEKFYFREGLTYVYITVKGFNVRYLPQDHIFGHAGNSIFPKNEKHIWPLLGLLNSGSIQFLLSLLTDSRKYEVGYVSRIPIPDLTNIEHLGDFAHVSHDLKAVWDTGNEICTRFTTPWLLQICKFANGRISEWANGRTLAPARSAGVGESAHGLGEVLELLGMEVAVEDITLKALLSHLEKIEQVADARLQQLQAQIDEAVYDLYEISPADRQLIERELGDRPPELVWPQLESKSKKAKRREHVRRLFSYYARQAVRQDEDGIVPLAGRAGRGGYLVDRVRALLEARFGPDIAYRLEQDAEAYIGRPVEEWLHRFFFHHFHTKLYKNRPILWHLTSSSKNFAVLLDYHRLDRDTLPKIKMHYLQPHLEEVSARLFQARRTEAATSTIAALEEEQADLEAFSRQLTQLIEAGYDPDIDDGVKVNLLPIQEAGLLPVKKVV